MMEEKKVPPTAIVPILERLLRDFETPGAAKTLHDLYGSYPLYAFFLYSERDKDLFEFIRLNGQWLHRLSGEDCLIGVFEKPGTWGAGWERYWREKLGSDFSQISDEWMKLTPFDRNIAFSLADLLEVEKNTLPCIVFMESSSQKEVMYIPIITDKSNYSKYFQDIFTAVRSAIKKAPAGNRLQAFHSKWRKVWIKWILPEKTKGMAKSLQEWGSIIKETTEPFVSLVSHMPVLP